MIAGALLCATTLATFMIVSAFKSPKVGLAATVMTLGPIFALSMIYIGGRDGAACYVVASVMAALAIWGTKKNG